MKTLRTVSVIVGAVILSMAYPAASGLVGIYGVIERVVFEPSDAAPERVQLWGAFAYANGGVGMATTSAVKRGFMYFRLPDSGVTTATDVEVIKREWADLKAVAGTSEAVGFGRWGYIGRFDLVTRGDTSAPHMFLERIPRGGRATDLRIRPVTEAPANPAAYQTNAGIVKLPAAGNHAELVAQLRAAIKR